MLIEQGKISRLNGLPWIGIELTNDARVEEVVLRIAQWAVRELRDQWPDGVLLVGPWAHSGEVALPLYHFTKVEPPPRQKPSPL